MRLDEIRVLRLLRSVTDDLAVLREEAAADDRRRADALWLRGVKYRRDGWAHVAGMEGEMLICRRHDGEP